MEVTRMVSLLVVVAALLLASPGMRQAQVSATASAPAYSTAGPGHGLNGPLNTFCHPGQSGVISCPCANPPIAIGRGCDNSAATGGASLYWSGNASLGNDTLVFATGFERPHALSILMQGTVQVASGMVY